MKNLYNVKFNLSFENFRILNIELYHSNQFRQKKKL